jgi:hypothetical protein
MIAEKPPDGETSSWRLFAFTHISRRSSMRRSHSLALILAATILLIGVAAARSAPAAPPSLGGCPLLPADNIWNVPIDNLPVAARSDDFINTIGRSTSLHPDFGANWNGGPFGIPYLVVPATQPLLPINFTDYGDESDPGPYPIPLNAPIEGGSDRHVLVVRQGECKLYELFDAAPNGGGWDAASGAVYTLTLNGPLRPDGWTSADAAGLPILPGLVRYDEVAAGEIHHALRFTANLTQKLHVWPARHDASSSTNPVRPPMGQRFRLKASVNIASYPPQVQVIFRALKTYGLILADNGSNWYISGAPDARWDDDMLVTAFRSLKGSDFEAVDVSSLMVNPDSGKVLTDFTLNAAPSARTIDPGTSTSYQLSTALHGYWSGPVTITASSPSPSVTIGLSGAIAAASIPVPGSITLLVTDTHPIGSPASWYAIPITATGNGVTHVVSAGLLVGGERVYLPLLRKS